MNFLIMLAEIVIGIIWVAMIIATSLLLFAIAYGLIGMLVR